MKKAYIIGAGGFSKEVYLLLKRVGKYQFCGFIDNQPDVPEIRIGTLSYPIISEEFFLNQQPDKNDTALFIGIGNPQIINKVATKFLEFDFPNLFSPCVEVDESVLFGKGNIITKGVNFTVDINVGNFNIFNLNTTIGHDVSIGDCNVLNPGVSVSGGIKIGSKNLIGTGACLLQYLSMGDDNTVGANGVLTKSIDNSKVMVGVPCKEMQTKK